MTEKIKIHADESILSLIKWVLDRLRTPRGIPKGLEVEGLVLLDWHQRNLVKITLCQAPVKINFRPHEALSLRRLLFGIDFSDPIADINRNNICSEIHKQLPGLC